MFQIMENILRTIIVSDFKTSRKISIIKALLTVAKNYKIY